MFDAESLFFSSFTHVLTHTLATELTKKTHKQLYALDFMINKKLKRNFFLH